MRTFRAVVIGDEQARVRGFRAERRTMSGISDNAIGSMTDERLSSRSHVARPRARPVISDTAAFTARQFVRCDRRGASEGQVVEQLSSRASVAGVASWSRSTAGCCAHCELRKCSAPGEVRRPAERAQGHGLVVSSSPSSRMRPGSSAAGVPTDHCRRDVVARNVRAEEVHHLDSGGRGSRRRHDAPLAVVMTHEVSREMPAPLWIRFAAAVSGRYGGSRSCGLFSGCAAFRMVWEGEHAG